MLERTHFVLGMASALVITQPQTVPEVIAAMTGGALGGWIVDVDLKNRDIEQSDEVHRENIYDTIIDAIFILAFIAVDFFIGKGMCQYVIDNWGVKVWGALFGILILMLIGLNTKHRTFTHSFLAMALFSGSVYLFCKSAAIPFLIGYGSHLISDFFNKLGLQLFFPFYLLGINAVSALLLYSWRKKKFKETDIKHTIILLLGALGGTVGSIPMGFFINRAG